MSGAGNGNLRELAIRVRPALRTVCLWAQPRDRLLLRMRTPKIALAVNFHGATGYYCPVRSIRWLLERLMSVLMLEIRSRIISHRADGSALRCFGTSLRMFDGVVYNLLPLFVTESHSSPEPVKVIPPWQCCGI